MNRRFFFGLIAAGGAVIVSGVIAIPALLMGLSPVLQRRRSEFWQPVGHLDDFPVGEVQMARLLSDRVTWPRSIGTQTVFVWRCSELECVVFSRSCTDLGCPLTYDDGSACFFCPCHGGIFTQNGQRLGGPPNKAMYRYTHRFRNGMIEINLDSLPASA